MNIISLVEALYSTLRRALQQVAQAALSDRLGFVAASPELVGGRWLGHPGAAAVVMNGAANAYQARQCRSPEGR